VGSTLLVGVVAVGAGGLARVRGWRGGLFSGAEGLAQRFLELLRGKQGANVGRWFLRCGGAGIEYQE
jgi:hypothetical protein